MAGIESCLEKNHNHRYFYLYGEGAGIERAGAPAAALDRNDERANLPLIDDVLDIIFGLRSDADSLPFALLDFQEGVDDAGIEVCAGAGDDLFARLKVGGGGAIRAVAGDGIESVGDREDA